MSEKLKQIDKKYIIIFGAIVGIIIFVIILMIVLKALSGPGKNYDKLESKLVSAAQDYLKENSEFIPEEGTSTVIDADTLISAKNLKDLSKYVDDTCTASVRVMNNGGKSLYLPDLQCSEYKTTHLKEKLIDDQLVVDSDDPYESGLYESEGEYIFKGKNVNNYVSFGGLVWRIMKIDENGNLRLIKNTAEKNKKLWDNKYNVSVKKNYGINDYKNSFILERLNDSYAEVNEKNKAHLIPHDVCVGKRAIDDMSISYSVDCTEMLEGQYISLINTLDYPMASLDENCKNVGDGACSNYNYLKDVISTSWTSIGVADNSYEVFYISSGYVSYLNSNKNNNFSWIVYLSGEELYKGGSGTEEDPYVIE